LNPGTRNASRKGPILKPLARIGRSPRTDQGSGREKKTRRGVSIGVVPVSWGEPARTRKKEGVSRVLRTKKKAEGLDKKDHESTGSEMHGDQGGSENVKQPTPAEGPDRSKGFRP